MPLCADLCLAPPPPCVDPEGLAHRAPHSLFPTTPQSWSVEVITYISQRVQAQTIMLSKLLDLAQALSAMHPRPTVHIMFHAWHKDDTFPGTEYPSDIRLYSVSGL